MGKRVNFASQLFTWRSALVTSDLPSQVRLVGLTLSLHMNERGGSCFPSQDTLSKETGLSVRQVRRHIATLRERDYLTVTYQERPSGRRAFYHASVPMEAYLLEGVRGTPPDTDDLWGEVTHDL